MEDLSIVRIELMHAKDRSDVVEKLIQPAQCSGALIGRAKNGSVALKFRSVRPHDTVPFVQGAEQYQRVFELATRDGATRIKVSTRSAAPLDGYKWDREIAHHDLPVMPYTAADVGRRIIEAVFALGLTWASIVEADQRDAERLAKMREDIAAGRVKIPTDDERQAALDAEICEANKSRDIGPFDGMGAQLILAARARLAMWRAKQAKADVA